MSVSESFASFTLILSYPTPTHPTNTHTWGGWFWEWACWMGGWDAPCWPAGPPWWPVRGGFCWWCIPGECTCDCVVLENNKPESLICLKRIHKLDWKFSLLLESITIYLLINVCERVREREIEKEWKGQRDEEREERETQRKGERERKQEGEKRGKKRVRE